MRTEQEIRQQIETLLMSIAKDPCPCGCEDEGRWATEMQVKALKWVLGEVEKL